MIKLSTDPKASHPTVAERIGARRDCPADARDDAAVRAVGHDIVLIETVGVGQSEVTVAETTDFRLVLTVAGAGTNRRASSAAA